MAWRKWIVRGMVFSVAALLGLTALAYERWTNASAIRQMVLSRLVGHLPGAEVQLISARLRLLGGISLEGLRLKRRDDPDAAEFLQVPSGAIFHDKEQLRNGKVVIRKIEWYHPTLRLIRNPEGRWNLSGILAPPNPEVAIPMIELQQATILIEDQQNFKGLPPLEITDVNLTIINDPHSPEEHVSALHFEGSGRSALVGPIQVSGSLERTTDEFKMSVQVPHATINDAFVKHLAAFSSDAAQHATHVQGELKLVADFSHQPQRPQPWSYLIEAHLAKGQVSHPDLPLSLEGVELKARCLDGRVLIDRFSAGSGPARLEITEAEASTLSRDTDMQAVLRVERMPLRPDVIARLPGKLPELEHRFSPRGEVDLTLHLRRRGGRWCTQCRAIPRELSGMFQDFPYPLDRVTGTIDFDMNPFEERDEYDLDLIGYAGSHPIYISGKVTGKAPAGVALKIKSTDLAFDERFRGALPPDVRKIVDAFHAQGLLNIDAHIQRAQGKSRFENKYHIEVHDTHVAHEICPYPIDNVSGILEVHPGHWKFSDFRGSHRGAEIVCQGSSVLEDSGRHVHISITGNNLILDGELRAALHQPGLQKAWRTFSPQGKMNFDAHVDVPPGTTEPDVAVRVMPQGATITPVFFSYPLREFFGEIRYHKREVELFNLRASHGYTELMLEHGKVLLQEDGVMSVDLVELIGNPLVPDKELVDALPEPLRRTLVRLQLNEPLSLRAMRLTIKLPSNPDQPPFLYWDGGINLKDAGISAGVQLQQVRGKILCRGEHHGDFGSIRGNMHLEQATLFGQTVRDIDAPFSILPNEPNLLRMPSVKGKLFGGDLGGAVQVRFAPELAFVLDLHCSQMKLEEFGRQNQIGPKAQMQGLASARVFLEGQGPSMQGLRGHGRIDVPSGKMYNLPLLLDLLKVLNGRLPDRTAFEEARMQFAIQGSRAEVTQLELFGNAVSLSGQGTVNLDGSNAQLDFFAVLGRSTQWLPRVLEKIPAGISQNLLKIKMRGNLSNGRVEVTKELVPFVVEPIAKLWERMNAPGGMDGPR